MSSLILSGIILIGGILLPGTTNYNQMEWSLHDHLRDKNIRAYGKEDYVWINNWSYFPGESRTGYFHPLLKRGLKYSKPHCGGIDISSYPFTETVEGKISPHQVHIHPDTPDIPTYVDIKFSHLKHAVLDISYALADKSLPLSNGVDLEISLICSKEQKQL